MEKSIEQLWKNSQAEKAPKIENLSDLQSIYFTDRLKRTYNNNVLILIATAVLVLAASIWGGVPWVGVYLFTLFAGPAFYGKITLDRFDRFEKSADSLSYVTAFASGMKRLLNSFARFYRFWVPALFIGMVLGLLRAEFFTALFGETLLELLKGDGAALIGGLPLWLIAVIGLGALAISYISQRIFQIEIGSIYGEQLAHLERLRADLQGLQ